MASEVWAAFYLVCLGYRILDRRYKTRVGEIDLIARRGRVLCFVEVKGRRSNANDIPVTSRQMNRIARASLLYMQSHPKVSELDMRYDVLIIRPWRWPQLLSDAWRPE